ncbi:hypothetical protein K2173_004845 [Erythroxylum novogranatense]|uniref:C2H2-type domain-containing protein n=1 Tax=Erythroxylum novogranatense TaxID=1862640 RepID=A0AAV8TCA0_9ROSI|nr:hypothetical protein K2173_004845 [Erythroxylum novogranatense]
MYGPRRIADERDPALIHVLSLTLISVLFTGMTGSGASSTPGDDKPSDEQQNQGNTSGNAAQEKATLESGTTARDVDAPSGTPTETVARGDSGKDKGIAGSVSAGESQEDASGKKKRDSRDDLGDAGASGSAVRAKRRSTGVVGADVPPICAVCGKTFSSFRAMCGHLRAHTKEEKPWKGAFPPPVFVADWGDNKRGEDDDDPEAARSIIEEEVVPALLSVAQEAVAKLHQEQVGSGVDLNVVPDDDETPQEPAAAGTQTKKLPADFDLNLPPPEDSDDEPPAA